MHETEKGRKPWSKKLKKERYEARDPSIIGTGHVFTFLLLISTFVIYDVIVITNLQDETSTDFQALKSELEMSVHCQPEPVAVILENLNKIQKNEQTIGIVNFIGSTGVGKTFIANIIKRHFSLFYESTGSLKTKLQHDIWSTIRGSLARYNLVVFDDLTVDDVDDLLVLIKGMPQDVATLVICIFNIQETDSFLNYNVNYDNIDLIESKFNSAEIKHDVAKFHEFSAGEVHDWIVNQLITKGVDAQYHTRIIESVFGGHNVKYHGLKGLNSKINLEL
ncbi:hypothetical protein Zmor_007286 [Zophobas morio]|uniref:Uncharacterized protein n=1 Tax=Zophobas morio TaxID=2755281 RepID=A0AA38ITH5_9CUCU|nr:hypothetical protein Zmor_007286 [Zophobas morio]